MTAGEPVTCSKCGHEKRSRLDNCRECDRRRQQEAEEREAKVTEVLKAAGFTAAFHVDGVFGFEGVRFTSCTKCGSAVALVPHEEGVPHPLDIHREWHA